MVPEAGVLGSTQARAAGVGGTAGGHAPTSGELEEKDGGEEATAGLQGLAKAP